ncbi:MAG TPA: hypothetical protein VGH90_09810, partial [Chthoniobacteraceae bacterium]
MTFCLPRAQSSAHSFLAKVGRKLAFASLAALAVTLSIDGAQAVTMPSEMIVRMGRGSNIGGALEAGSGFPTIPSYYFDDLESMGYMSIRLPVAWSPHTSTSSPYTIDPNWLANVK